MRRAVSGIAIALLVVGASSCGTPTGTPESKLSLAQVEQQAQTYVRSAARATVGDQVRLASLGFGEPKTTAACSDLSNPPEGTPVYTEFVYKLEGAEPAQRATYFDRFRSFLREEGWRVTYEDASAKAIIAEKDNYVLNLRSSPSDALLSLGVNTPCVAPPSA